MERVEESAGKWIEVKTVDDGFWHFNVNCHLQGGTIADELMDTIITG